MSVEQVPSVELHDNPVLGSHVQYTDGTLTHVCRELSQNLSQYGVVRLCYATFYRGDFWMCYSDKTWNNLFIFLLTEYIKYPIQSPYIALSNTFANDFDILYLYQRRYRDTYIIKRN